MKVKTSRLEEPKEADRVVIFIGEHRFSFMEKFGRLEITKVSDGESDLINIQPRTGNQIELF